MKERCDRCGLFAEPPALVVVNEERTTTGWRCLDVVECELRVLEGHAQALSVLAEPADFKRWAKLLRTLHERLLGQLNLNMSLARGFHAREDAVAAARHDSDARKAGGQ